MGGVHRQLPNLPAPRRDSQGDVGRALALHQAQRGPPSSPEWVACLSRSHGGCRQVQLLSWPGVAGTPGKFQVACVSNTYRAPLVCQAWCRLRDMQVDRTESP